MPHSHAHDASAGDELIRGAWFYEVRSALLGLRGRRLWRSLADALQLRAGDRVLDVGCGPGRLVRVLSRQVGPTGSAVGVDAAEEMIKRARSRRPAGKYRNTEFRVARAQELPFADGEFDAVSCTLVLHHVAAADRAEAVREAFRVLAPGGRLVVAEFDPVHRPWSHRLGRSRPHHQHALAEARTLVAAAGFTDITTGPTPVRWAERIVARKP